MSASECSSAAIRSRSAATKKWKSEREREEHALLPPSLLQRPLCPGSRLLKSSLKCTQPRTRLQAAGRLFTTDSDDDSARFRETLESAAAAAAAEIENS